MSTSQLPLPTLTRPRWIRAVAASIAAAVTLSVAEAVLTAVHVVSVDHWSRTWVWVAAWLCVAMSALCAGRAFVEITPKRGRLVLTDGSTLRVRFRPDPDGPPGVFVAVVGGEPYTQADNIRSIRLVNAQIHHVLRFGDVRVPISAIVADLLASDGRKPVEDGELP